MPTAEEFVKPARRRAKQQYSLVECRKVNTEAFADGMYQWAATLTVSGQNMPFTMPLQTDKTDGGFDIAFLRLIDGNIIRTARIACHVEASAQVCTGAPARLRASACRLHAPLLWACAPALYHISAQALIKMQGLLAMKAVLRDIGRQRGVHSTVL